MSGTTWFLRLAKWGLLVGFFLCLYFLMQQQELFELKQMIHEHRLTGALLFGFIMFGTTVVAPLTSFPLIPMIAPLLGPFMTGTACFIGWTLGAVVAFLIGRHFGQSYMSKFISMETLTKYESRIPSKGTFMLIVALRMILPVDIASYALGIFSTVSFRVYTVATILGVGWFSYAFAYGSQALVTHDYVLLAYIGVASVVLLFVSWQYARRMLTK